MEQRQLSSSHFKSLHPYGKSSLFPSSLCVRRRFLSHLNEEKYPEYQSRKRKCCSTSWHSPWVNKWCLNSSESPRFWIYFNERIVWNTEHFRFGKSRSLKMFLKALVIHRHRYNVHWNKKKVKYTSVHNVFTWLVANNKAKRASSHLDWASSHHRWHFSTVWESISPFVWSIPRQKTTFCSTPRIRRWSRRDPILSPFARRR